jgi:hypothetical protein
MSSTAASCAWQHCHNGITNVALLKTNPSAAIDLTLLLQVGSGCQLLGLARPKLAQI